jgi:hypothetical protein
MHMKECALSTFNYCQPNKNIKKFICQNKWNMSKYSHIWVLRQLSLDFSLVFKFFWEKKNEKVQQTKFVITMHDKSYLLFTLVVVIKLFLKIFNDLKFQTF